MHLPKFLTKFLAVLLSIITPVACVMTLDLTARFDKAIPEALEKAGGFMAGVCHPEPEYDMITGANIGWIREDMPMPVDADGNVTDRWERWKAEMQAYADHGIKLMTVTPYPDDYRAIGLDIRNEADIPGIQAIARFIIEDLQGIAGGIQVTNEMGVDRFTLPLTMDEAAKFIGVQLEAMYPLRGDVLLGYNLGGLGFLQLPFRMMKYHKYCDYIGVDLYLGSFENIVKDINLHMAILQLVRLVTHKPIIMQEFGYIGFGEPKTQAEKTEILRSYGFESEAAARADIWTFVNRLPKDLAEEINENYADRSDAEVASLVFDGEYANHIYRELAEGTGLRGYEHSPEGQAKFYADLIPKLKNCGFVIGAFLYMWNDSEHCYVCGQSDCPVETGWGIVDGEGNPKPAYYAVRDAFAQEPTIS